MGETIVEFDAALGKLVVHCQFGEMLEASLCDQFVCGLCYNAIQRRLRPLQRRGPSRQTQQSRSWKTCSQKSRVFQSVTTVVVQTISQRTASSRISDDSGEFLPYKVGSRSSDLTSVPMLLNGKELAMAVDTGTTLSVISESTRQTVFPEEPLHPSKLILKS